MAHIVYGGTFDPVHRGHIAIARAVCDVYQDTVWLMPAADPPHRAPPGASAHQRAQMLDLAVADEPRLAVDRRELQRHGPSYTVDTLAELRRELGAGETIIWVMGIDSLRQLDTWHHWQRIFEFAHVLAVERPGAPPDAAWLREQAPAVAGELEARRCLPAALLKTAAGAFAELPMRPLRLESATEVRARVARGGDWQALVPEEVARFISQQGLYRPGAAGQGV
jgi:nicotinate-nucleotide adenylyltransferase